MPSRIELPRLSGLALAGVLLAACSGGPPPNGVARAGTRQEVARGEPVTLDGSGSSDPEGEPLTYEWRQVHGPDVTEGAGVLTGASPTFAAPATVCTLLFDLRVNDGHGSGAPDRVQIDVLEDPEAALWVDGDAGNDVTADGSRAMPFATIGRALVAVSVAPGRDLYVLALGGGAAYRESGGVVLPGGTSLYGGYGPGWVRDTSIARTRFASDSRAFMSHQNDSPAWISGFDLSVTSGDRAVPLMGIVVVDLRSHLVVEDNVIVVGPALRAPPDAEVPVGNGSYGIYVQASPACATCTLTIDRNHITARAAAEGRPGDAGGDGPVGSRGGDAVEHVGGAGAAWPPVAGYRGGAGGQGGGGLFSNGAEGEHGGVPPELAPYACGSGGYGGGSGGPGSASEGGDGVDGCPGSPGQEGTGGSGDGIRGRGFDGTGGQAGGGGGGGGGGEGGAAAADGAGGGGGGQGGAGGRGGSGGEGGGTSCGIVIYSGPAITIRANTIRAGGGGGGAAGGEGGAGGAGGDPGAPGTPDPATVWGRGGVAGGLGGSGGAGGPGGKGGAGGGGASYGVLVHGGLAPVLEDNVISSGDGGPGGDNGGVGHGGQGGHSFAVYDTDVADGASPVFRGANELSHGSAGAGGGPDGAPGVSGGANFALPAPHGP